MKIHYIANDLKKLEALKRKEKSFLALRQDFWDDYTYKTYFQVYFISNGEEVEISSLRILVENEKTTLNYFNNLVAQGWNGVFPLEGVNYISVPSSVDFYKIIDGKMGTRSARKAAKSLKDAGYMVNVEKDSTSVRLVDSEGFRTSLQRESGAIKAFEDGWKFLQKVHVKIDDFSFFFKLPNKKDPININFCFNSDILPYDINILVGPNGTGKSQALQHIVECLLKIGRGDQRRISEQRFQPFLNRPTVSHVIVVSYSPFEEFIIDIDDYELTDKEVYKYFGFRRKQISENGKTITGISRIKPATDSVESLLRCIYEDNNYGYISDWVNKFRSANQILHQAIDYEFLALEIPSDESYTSLELDFIAYENPIIKFGDKSYFVLRDEIVSLLDVKKISDHVEKKRGVVFIKNGSPIYLSSGQRLFSYIVINT